MKLTGSRKYYTPPPPKLPPGLVELMEGLTKEVLKHNPSDVYSFCASHMEQLLEKRDGTSRKKLLSLKDKIKKVQEKVRQRAERRRQGYDKTLIQDQSNDTVNTDLTFNVPKLITTQESPIPTVSDVNNSVLMHDEVIGNIVKAPIYHEHVLENLSEMEISHEFDSNIATLIQNINKNDVVLKTDHYLSNQNDNVNKAEVIGDLVRQGNINENQIKTESSTIITPDAETVHEHVVNLDSNKTTDIASDIVSETSIVIEQSNRSFNDDVPIQGIDVEINQEGPKPAGENKLTVDSIKILSKTVDSSKKISRDTKDKDVPAVVDDKNNMAMAVEDHKKKSSEKENSDTISMSDSLNGIDKPIDKKIISIPSKVAEIPSPVNLQETNKIEQTSNKIEQMQQTNNNNKNTSAENIRLSTHTKKVEQSKDIIESTNQANNTTVKQESVTKNNNSETKNNEDLKPSHRSTVETSNNIEISPLPNMEVLNNKLENLEVKQINSINQEVKKETTSISESHFDLLTSNNDSDILAFISENTVIEAHHASKLNNDISEIIEIDVTVNKSPAENKPVIVDKEILKSDDFPFMDNNSTRAIENKAGNSDISYSETLNNVSSEKTQNDNHDSNMDIETAAVTIQKVFRNFLFKSRGSTFEDAVNDETHFMDEDDKNKANCDFPIASALNVDRRAHGITRMDTVLQTVNEEKSLSLSDDSSTLSSAATIIQAHVRGFLVRNKFNSNKTVSTNSLAASNSNEPSITSIEVDNDQYKNKTVLNIHIVPGGDNYLSRDESLITSMELSLDSPPSSVNLHPLGYDKSERRKQLKREDAIQSISPPSNNSGKLSEDFDSVKEIPLNDVAEQTVNKDDVNKDNGLKKPVTNVSLETVTKTDEENENNIKSVLDKESHLESNMTSFIKINSDEMDVVTPFEESVLLHSGEFHDAVLPTRVSRSDTSVVSGE